MKSIGVLALQGAFREHRVALESLGYSCVEVRNPGDLQGIDGLIIPGGESTAMGRLLEGSQLKELLYTRISSGLPVWGTCAGMILLAREIAGQDEVHLPLMDIRVRRNAYGRQLDSFYCEAPMSGVAHDIRMPFIRAPYIEEAGDRVTILSQVDGNIVAAREGNILVTSFHPELTEDRRVHRYFAEKMIA